MNKFNVFIRDPIVREKKVTLMALQSVDSHFENMIQVCHMTTKLNIFMCHCKYTNFLYGAFLALSGLQVFNFCKKMQEKTQSSTNKMG